MQSHFDVNGLLFWDAEEIHIRRWLSDQFAFHVATILRRINAAWTFHEIEAPILTPRHLVNKNYSNENMWVQESFDTHELVLRPETTPSSYIYACYLLNAGLSRPPFVVYQTGKSFRREQDQVTKNMRLKEFYQQEFQCVYTIDTANDYQEAILKPLATEFQVLVGLPCKIVNSDRLPSYSKRTLDLEINSMECCSISKRTDFPIKYRGSKGEKELLVLEIAIGLDRCVYQYLNRKTIKD